MDLSGLEDGRVKGGGRNVSSVGKITGIEKIKEHNNICLHSSVKTT
jgi:hypothetical protein